MTKERPILFNGEMVRAILSGRKTQTRRIVKPHQPLGMGDKEWKDVTGKSYGRPLLSTENVILDFEKTPIEWFKTQQCPFGKVGDRLWVRETWIKGVEYEDGCPTDTQKIWYRATDPDLIWYDDDSNDCEPKWKPSIHMPRWASRINLEITNVRAEHLNEITFNDALKEGCTTPQPLESFEKLWNSVYKNWKDNPWVWVVEFKRVQ